MKYFEYSEPASLDEAVALLRSGPAPASYSLSLIDKYSPSFSDRRLGAYVFNGSVKCIRSSKVSRLCERSGCEYNKAILHRVHRTNSCLNAIVALRAQAALVEVKAADQILVHKRGLLPGNPSAVQDTSGTTVAKSISPRPIAERGDLSELEAALTHRGLVGIKPMRGCDSPALVVLSARRRTLSASGSFLSTADRRARQSVPVPSAKLGNSRCSPRMVRRNDWKTINFQRRVEEMPPCNDAPSHISHGWRVATPSSSGLNSEKLRQLSSYFRRNAAENMHSVLIARHGKLVFQEYYSGEDEKFNDSIGQVQFGPDVLHDLRSITKSVISVMFGIALDKGWIRGLDDSILSYLPKYKQQEAEDRRAISFRHALSMSSGIFATESSLPFSDPKNTSFLLDSAF